jgi:hypothetical protein
MVRYGNRGGQEARVVEKQPAEVYKVRFPDGAFLYYSGAGLRLVPGALAAARPVSAAWDLQSRN